MAEPVAAGAEPYLGWKPRPSGWRSSCSAWRAHVVALPRSPAALLCPAR